MCGRYEGVDERVGARSVDEQLSIGDFVLAGGELAAAVVIEAVARLVPGVLGCGLSARTNRSRAAASSTRSGRARPTGRATPSPPVLLSGDHAAIARWRRREALRRTLERRPDLLAAHPLTAEERAPAGRAEDDQPSGSTSRGESPLAA